MLQRRLTRLEKKLNIPLEDRHISAGHLLKAEETTVIGTRIPNRVTNRHLDNSGKPPNDFMDSLHVKADTSPSTSSRPKTATLPLKHSVEVKYITMYPLRI